MKILLTSCTFALCLSLCPVSTLASDGEIEEKGAFQRSSSLVRHTAQTTEDLKYLLSNVSGDDTVGFDCDNTLINAAYPAYRGIYDYEMMREFQGTFWKFAGDAAKEQQLYPQESNSEKFADFCWNLLCRTSAKKEYALVDEEMPALNADLQQKADTFICTGLPPEREKLDALVCMGLDFSTQYSPQHKAYPLFVGDYRGKMSGWLYARNKAASLGQFVLASNEERALQEKKPLSTLYYIDNHIETLDDIARDFAYKVTGVKMVLIHWQAHARTLHARHQQGEFIPLLLENLKKLIEVTSLRVSPLMSPRGDSDVTCLSLTSSQQSLGSSDKKRQVLDESSQIPSSYAIEPQPFIASVGLNLMGCGYGSGDEVSDEETPVTLSLTDAGSSLPLVTARVENRSALRCSSEALTMSGVPQEQEFLRTSQSSLVNSGEFHS